MDGTALTTTHGKNWLKKTAALARQPLFANAGYLMGINLVSSVAGFVFWTFAARLYQPEDVGRASAVLSAVALVSSIARLGMDQGLVRMLPAARSPKRLLNTAFTADGLAALLVGMVFLGGLPLWSPSLIALQQHTWYAVAFVAYATVATLGTVVQMAFVARRQARYALAHTCVINGARLALVVALASMGAPGIVGSVGLAFALALGVSLWRFLPKVEPGYRPCPGISRRELADIVPYSLGNHIAGLLAGTSQTILPLLILETMGPVSNGHAYVALMLGGLLASPGQALAGSAFAEGSNSPQRSQAILNKAGSLGLGVTVVTSVGVGVASPWLLRLFGPSYADEASGLLRWLALAAPPIVLSGLYFTHLRVQKQIGRLILLSTIVATVTLGTAATLMPRLGIAANGVALLLGHSLVTSVALGEWFRRDRTGEVPETSHSRSTPGPGGDDARSTAEA